MKERMPDGRRSSGSNKIPEEIQESIRERLRKARLSRGVSQTGLKAFSGGQVRRWEGHDVSSAKLGDIMALGEEWGIPLREFMMYLLGEEELRSDTTRHTQRMGVYLTALPLELQELACDMVQRLVEHHVKEEEQRKIAYAPGVRRNAREAVRGAPASSGRA